jgi:tight adherence protein B
LTTGRRRGGCRRDLPDRDRNRGVRLAGSGVSARLERYASARQSGKPEATAPGGIADLLAQSVALAQLNRVVEQRDFGANLARDIARADLKLKPSEFLAIWAARSSAPVAVHRPVARPAGAAQPDRPLVGAFLGFMLPRFWLNRARRPAERVQQAAPGHDHPAGQRPPRRSSFLQAVELVVRESRPPMSTEFSRVIREVNLGLPFEAAMENMVRRVRSRTSS